MKKDKNIQKNTKEIAIKVENVSKTFRIPHEKNSSLKSAALNVFKKKSYTNFEAAKNISFEVKKGEFFGIIGRNGSGKSTLLKMLAGIYTPDSGKITINGKLSPFLELGVGFNPELTARENVYLGGTILGLTHKEIDKKFKDIINFAELEEFVDMKFKNFSSGMQVRLAFALSINAHAEILLMDEVLAVGDSNFQSKCIAEFNNYKRLGKTVLLVSHDIGTIQKYCDRAILLRNGRVKIVDRAARVVNEYINENIYDINHSDNNTDTVNNPSKIKKSAFIVSASLVDKNNINKKAIGVGETIKFKIMIEKSKNFSDKELNIGVGIYTEDDVYVFGYNTQMDNFVIKNNQIILSIEKPTLLKGSYYANIVCFGQVEEKFFDFKSRVINFEIFPGSKNLKYRGIINIPHKWS